MLTDDAKAITSAAAEDRVGELELFQAAREESNHAFSEEAVSNVTDISTLETDDADQAGQRGTMAAFQAAMSEALQEAETQLSAIIERVRKEAADEHTAEFARVREELERQHADDLERARINVVESFKTLTGIFLRQA